MAIMAQNINRRPGYKQTEIGMIPDDWEMKTVGESFDICNYLRYPISQDVRKKMVGIYPYYGPTKAQDYINEYRVEGEYALIGEDGDHFLKWRDSPMTLLVNGKFNVNNHAHLVKGTKNLTAWFYYYFQNKDLTPYLTRQGAGRYKLTKSTLITIPCPLPSPLEQHAIVTTLSDIDALITSLDKLIAKKRDIKQAAMQQLLTGKMRLPGFSGKLKTSYKQTEIGLIPTDWNVCSVKEIADVTTGDKDTQDRTESGAYPFFVRSQIIERINSYSYDGEAVLTAGDGVGVGKVFHYVNGKFDFHQRVYMICNFRNFDGFFFYLYFSNYFSKEATKYNAKNSVDSVRREMVTGMKIPYPSLPEQQAIATVLTDMDAEIAALEQRREKTRMLKQGMMQELLTGKTRLV